MRTAGPKNKARSAASGAGDATIDAVLQSAAAARSQPEAANAYMPDHTAMAAALHKLPDLEPPPLLPFSGFGAGAAGGVSQKPRKSGRSRKGSRTAAASDAGLAAFIAPSSDVAAVAVDPRGSFPLGSGLSFAASSSSGAPASFPFPSGSAALPAHSPPASFTAGLGVRGELLPLVDENSMSLPAFLPSKASTSGLSGGYSGMHAGSSSFATGGTSELSRLSLPLGYTGMGTATASSTLSMSMRSLTQPGASLSQGASSSISSGGGSGMGNSSGSLINSLASSSNSNTQGTSLTAALGATSAPSSFAMPLQRSGGSAAPPPYSVLAAVPALAVPTVSLAPSDSGEAGAELYGDYLSMLPAAKKASKESSVSAMGAGGASTGAEEGEGADTASEAPSEDKRGKKKEKAPEKERKRRGKVASKDAAAAAATAQASAAASASAAPASSSKAAAKSPDKSDAGTRRSGTTAAGDDDDEDDDDEEYTDDDSDDEDEYDDDDDDDDDDEDDDEDDETGTGGGDDDDTDNSSARGGVTNQELQELYEDRQWLERGKLPPELAININQMQEDDRASIGWLLDDEFPLDLPDDFDIANWHTAEPPPGSGNGGGVATGGAGGGGGGGGGGHAGSGSGTGGTPGRPMSPLRLHMLHSHNLQAHGAGAGLRSPMDPSRRAASAAAAASSSALLSGLQGGASGSAGSGGDGIKLQPVEGRPGEFMMHLPGGAAAVIVRFQASKDGSLTMVPVTAAEGAAAAAAAAVTAATTQPESHATTTPSAQGSDAAQVAASPGDVEGDGDAEMGTDAATAGPADPTGGTAAATGGTGEGADEGDATSGGRKRRKRTSTGDAAAAGAASAARSRASGGSKRRGGRNESLEAAPISALQSAVVLQSTASNATGSSAPVESILRDAQALAHLVQAAPWLARHDDDEGADDDEDEDDDDDEDDEDKDEEQVEGGQDPEASKDSTSSKKKPKAAKAPRPPLTGPRNLQLVLELCGVDTNTESGVPLAAMQLPEGSKPLVKWERPASKFLVSRRLKQQLKHSPFYLQLQPRSQQRAQEEAEAQAQAQLRAQAAYAGDTEALSGDPYYALLRAPAVATRWPSSSSSAPAASASSSASASASWSIADVMRVVQPTTDINKRQMPLQPAHYAYFTHAQYVTLQVQMQQHVQQLLQLLAAAVDARNTGVAARCRAMLLELLQLRTAATEMRAADVGEGGDVAEDAGAASSAGTATSASSGAPAAADATAADAAPAEQHFPIPRPPVPPPSLRNGRLTRHAVAVTEKAFQAFGPWALVAPPPSTGGASTSATHPSIFQSPALADDKAGKIMAHLTAAADYEALGLPVTDGAAPARSGAAAAAGPSTARAAATAQATAGADEETNNMASDDIYAQFVVSGSASAGRRRRSSRASSSVLRTTTAAAADEDEEQQRSSAGSGAPKYAIVDAVKDIQRMLEDSGVPKVLQLHRTKKKSNTSSGGGSGGGRGGSNSATSLAAAAESILGSNSRTATALAGGSSASASSSAAPASSSTTGSGTGSSTTPYTTPEEDLLLFLGLMRYSQRDWTSVRKQLLPCKTEHQLLLRSKNAAARSSGSVAGIAAASNTEEAMAALRDGGSKVLLLASNAVWERHLHDFSRVERQLLVDAAAVYGFKWSFISAAILPHRGPATLEQLYTHHLLTRPLEAKLRVPRERDTHYYAASSGSSSLVPTTSASKPSAAVVAFAAASLATATDTQVGQAAALRLVRMLFPEIAFVQGSGGQHGGYDELTAMLDAEQLQAQQELEKEKEKGKGQGAEGAGAGAGDDAAAAPVAAPAIVPSYMAALSGTLPAAVAATQAAAAARVAAERREAKGKGRGGRRFSGGGAANFSSDFDDGTAGEQPSATKQQWLHGMLMNRAHEALASAGGAGGATGGDDASTVFSALPRNATMTDSEEAALNMSSVSASPEGTLKAVAAAAAAAAAAGAMHRYGHSQDVPVRLFDSLLSATSGAATGSSSAATDALNSSVYSYNGSFSQTYGVTGGGSASASYSYALGGRLTSSTVLGLSQNSLGGGYSQSQEYGSSGVSGPLSPPRAMNRGGSSSASSSNAGPFGGIRGSFGSPSRNSSQRTPTRTPSAGSSPPSAGRLGSIGGSPAARGRIGGGGGGGGGGSSSGTPSHPSTLLLQQLRAQGPASSLSLSQHEDNTTAAAAAMLTAVSSSPVRGFGMSPTASLSLSTSTSTGAGAGASAKLAASVASLAAEVEGHSEGHASRLPARSSPARSSPARVSSLSSTHSRSPSSALARVPSSSSVAGKRARSEAVAAAEAAASSQEQQEDDGLPMRVPKRRAVLWQPVDQSEDTDHTDTPAAAAATASVGRSMGASTSAASAGGLAALMMAAGTSEPSET